LTKQQILKSQTNEGGFIMKRKNVLLLIIMSIFIISLIGSANAQATAAGNPDMLTIVVATDPMTMDPAINTYFAARQVGRHVYEPLFRLDADFNLLPMLAKEWRYLDDNTVEIKLQEGVKFHNGDPLTPEDVLFSFKRSFEEKTAAFANVEHIDFDKCKVIDATTFNLVTTAPKANQLQLLSMGFAGIFSKSDFENKNGNFFQKIAGTGPYVLDDYVLSDYYNLTSFEDYWDSSISNRFKKLRFRVITEGSNRTIEAETGRADIVYDIPATDKARVMNAPNLQYLYAYSANTSYIFLNMAKEPLDDIRVRQAIWHGIDRELVVAIAYKTMGKLPNTFFSEGIKGTIDISSYLVERDVEKAKQLLADAGYPNGLTLEFAAESNQPMRMDVAEAVQAQLAEIGIQVKLNFMDANAYSDYTCSGQHTLCVYGFSAATGEAGNGLSRFTPSMTYYYLSSHEDKSILDKIYTGLVTIDEATRNKLYEDAQIGLMNHYCAIPIWSKEINAAVANYVDMTDFYLDRSYETHLLTGVRIK